MYIIIYIIAHIGSCLIEKDSGTSVGSPSTRGDPETTYSCVATDNSNYDVHVIGNYESSNGMHGFRVQRVAGDTDVQLRVIGQSSRPLILVLVSYEPVIWRLSITGAAVIDRVILVSTINSCLTINMSRICCSIIAAGGKISKCLYFFTEWILH